jgi:peptidoglycan/xylan/chitin deacetylase (PgdA/CDA1 family)
MAEFALARREFKRIFGSDAPTAGAAGWQSNAHSREAYDHAGLIYASDARGTSPHFPRIGGHVFSTLEIPTTLPTIDELLGRPEYPDDRLVDHYAGLLRDDRVNVFTLHAEIEGLGRRELFRELISRWIQQGAQFIRLDDYARELLAHRSTIPVCDQQMAPIDGRSGVVATQGSCA